MPSRTITRAEFEHLFEGARFVELGEGVVDAVDPDGDLVARLYGDATYEIFQ
jgi:hypothetical protein